MRVNMVISLNHLADDSQVYILSEY